eukprot:scaffold24796_cov211-Cylindrotheca_fusiformis.AAC.1
MKSIFNWMLLGITALAILGRVEVLAYIPRQPELAFPVASSTQLAQSTKSSFAENDDDVMRGPEKSRMTEFAAQFLRRTSQKNNPTAKERQIFNSDNLDGSTHLVAIPMDACHELLLELESVQRAILYHCPILLDSCIPASMTRLPLLYVRAEHQNSALVTSFLADAATELARKHLFTSLDDDDLNEDSALTPDDLNEDGFLPFTLTFQSLEIDGSNNNVLNTVGLPNDSRTKRLQAFVYDLREAVNEKGWEAALPMDPHEPAMRSAGGFRPRIPFMELPKPFDDNLNRFKREDTAISDEDMGFLKAEKGGNGISPIFWCQWWDDTFARTCRLREIGVYPHTQSKSSDLSYSSFYLPYETIPLPDGTASMRKAEQKFEKYQDERMLEEQKEYERGSTSNGTDTSEKQKAEPDILMTKTRDRLEELYMGSAEKVGNVESIAEAAADSPPNRTHAAQEDDEDGGDLDLKPVTASPDDFIDDWMKNRIQNIVNSRESIKSRVPLKKEKPPVEDNPVFQAYKEGKLVPETKKRERKSRDLGPYPGNDHFVGIWRVDNSPTGFPAEESTENSSENLVLRIDGTTAGGPVLDPETKQKAAGGTWKFFHEENGDVRLRIRLVIPPQKDRILVMEGIVNRMTFNSEVPMTSKAFGIPHLEEKLKSASKNPEGDILQCGGEVFVEDAVTKKNRENIGSFSLMKLKGPLAKGDYTITIPKPTRNQD